LIIDTMISTNIAHQSLLKKLKKIHKQLAFSQSLKCTYTSSNQFIKNFFFYFFLKKVELDLTVQFFIVYVHTNIGIMRRFKMDWFCRARFNICFKTLLSMFAGTYIRVARFFFEQHTKRVKICHTNINIPQKDQMEVPRIRSNGHYINIPASSIARPSKIYQKLDFWFENMPSGNPAEACSSCIRPTCITFIRYVLPLLGQIYYVWIFT
jgi:hypothetical protein